MGRGVLRTDRLVAEHGAGIPVPALLRLIAADCPTRCLKDFHGSKSKLFQCFVWHG